ISIKNLSKIFVSDKQRRKAVDDLTLEINEGEIFGVIGYRGAGKSTFVRLLNRLEEPTNGRVIIGDKDMTSLRGKELLQAREEFSMCFQHFNFLWSRTV